MTRKFYHLMGSLDSLLRYLGTAALNPANVICAGSFPSPAGDPDQAYKNVECIRRAIQAKAQALSTALDDIVDAREEVFELIRNAYGDAAGDPTFKHADLVDAMAGSRVRRRTFPQMSFLDIAFAITEKTAFTTVANWVARFRQNALPAFHFVDGLARAAQANAELLAVAEDRGHDLLEALEVLNPTTQGDSGPAHNLDPTLQLQLKRFQADLQEWVDAGGGGPGDLVWPRIITSSSSSSSSGS